MPSYEPQVCESLLRTKSPKRKPGRPCAADSMGKLAVRNTRVDARGVYSERSPYHYCLSLTADDMCVKVVGCHDLQTEGRSVPH